MRSATALTRPRAIGRILLAVPGLAACYAAAAFLGLRFAIPPGNATAIWPSSGIALAGLLFLGPWAALGIFLGATLANLTTSVSLPGAVAIGLGNTLEAVIGAALLGRGGRTASARFHDAKGVFEFTAIATCASLAGASVGSATLELSGRLHGASAGLNWLTWWLGDTAGLVIVTPLLIALRGGWRLRASPARWIEAALALAGLGLVSQALFGGLLDPGTARDFLYLPLFFLIWLALRFGLRGMTAATFLMMAAAVWGTSRGVGVYALQGVPAALLDLQLLMIGYAIVGLVMVATVDRRRRAEVALLGSRRRLLSAVKERTADLRETMAALQHETAERARLQEMERLCLAAALDSAGEGIIITDAAAVITHVNPAFERMTGYSRDDVVGRHPRVLSSGTNDAAVYRQLWDTIADGKVWRGSFVDRKKDASHYLVDSTIAPIQQSDGRLAGYVAVTRDVTLQRIAERALRDSESRLRTIFEAAADGILTVDEDGIIESANPAVEAMFGRASRELVGRPAATIVPEFHDGEGAGRAFGVLREVVGHRRDGTTFPMDLMLNELLLEGRRLYAGFLRDASERNARLDAERALLRTHEELRLARTIQQRSFPEAAPDVPGFDIAGAAQPAEEAGGDYFDYLPMAGGQVGLVIGDVSGHGLGPALLMSQTRAYLHALLSQTQDVGELLTRLNEFLLADCGGVSFVTLFLARIDPRMRRMVCVGAGHQSYLLRADGHVETLAATDIPLGILSRRYVGGAELALDPGDLLLMVTDGIEETLSPARLELGLERVLEVAESNRHRPAHEIVTCLRETASRHAAGATQQDDITVVVAKILA